MEKKIQLLTLSAFGTPIYIYDIYVYIYTPINVQNISMTKYEKID